MTIKLNLDTTRLAALIAQLLDELQAALVRIAKVVAREGMQEWQRVTPRRTGALRGSLAVRVIRRGAGAYAEFTVNPPGDDYYASVNRRYRMTERLIAWAKRNLPRIAERELRKAVQAAEAAGRRRR